MNQISSLDRNRRVIRPEDSLRDSMRGFSLLEVMVILGIILIIAAFSTLGYQQAQASARVTAAYNGTLSQLRQAHDQAVAQRRVIVAVFDNSVTPNTVTVSQNDTVASGGTLVSQFQLPTDVSFLVQSGMPATAPDSLGIEYFAIDFPAGTGNKNLYFYPDGTVRKAASGGQIKSGVVYLGRAGNVVTMDALTIWGATGRIRGWRLIKQGTVPSWEAR